MKIQLPVIRVGEIENLSPLPEKQTAGSAGLDLRAAIETPMTLAPFQRALLPTGIAIAVPAGHEAQIRPRSGLALRHGVVIPNAPGTVDSDYRGELKVILMNLGQEPYTVQPGDRIAQLVVVALPEVQCVLVESLEDTDRGSGGFGHTGR